MINPQKENGYTAIANEILERIIKTDLSGHEFRLLFFILRKTYGYQKKEDFISLSQMVAGTCLSKTRCSQVINRLEKRNIVTVTEKCNGTIKKYLFNKYLHQWKGVTEKCNGYRKVNLGVTEKCNQGLQKSVTTKETITKESIQKKERVLFRPPSIEDVDNYCKERGNTVNAELFIDFYESKGWVVGRSKMKDWKAAVRTWEKRHCRPFKEKKKSVWDTNIEKIARGDY